MFAVELGMVYSAISSPRTELRLYHDSRCSRYVEGAEDLRGRS